jgi:cholesterol transport system auxiliary component
MGRIPRFGRAASVAVLAALVGGCAGLTAQTPPPTYELFAAKSFPRPAGGARGQLIVPEPTALAPLDTDRVLVRLGGGATAQLGNAQWEDRLPKLLQARIVQSFENGNRLRAVGKPGDKLVADYQLVTDVRAFQIAADTGTAEVEIVAKIVNDRNGRIGAARVFKVSVPAESTEGAGAIAAINAAFNQAVTEMVLWVSRQV